MNDEFSVLTPAEVATLLKVPEEAVVAALDAGRLKGFRIGQEWRTTYDFFRQMISAPTNIPSAVEATVCPPGSSVPSTDPSEQADSPVKGIPTLEQFKQMSWQKVGAFRHQWPRSASDVEGAGLEAYENSYQGVITIEGKEMPFVIAQGTRPAAGKVDRARFVVFKGKLDKTLYPLVEFTGSNDFDTSGKMASIIRRDGRKPVRPGELLPAVYNGMPVGIYNEVVVGPRAWYACAVLANKTDFAVMVRHAVLRDKGLG